MTTTAIHPKKHLGQHFLTAPYYAKRIAQAIPAKPGDLVAEIGPGTGALSVHLKERFPGFHCIEKDRDVVPRLEEKLGREGFVLHQADILEFDFSEIGFPLHVAGNLPYSIGALIIKKILLIADRISSATFMVQKEVAMRIAASPHSKTCGFLSVFCQYFGKPVILFDVPPGAFFPKPKVTSAVFQIIPDSALYGRLERSQWEDFFAFVTRGFSMRRKKLSNSLGRGGAAEAMGKSGLDANARAEDLTVEQWLGLYRLLCAH